MQQRHNSLEPLSQQSTGVKEWSLLEQGTQRGTIATAGVWHEQLPQQLQRQSLDIPQLADQPKPQLQLPQAGDHSSSSCPSSLTASSRSGVTNDVMLGYLQPRFDVGFANLNLQQQQQQQQQFMGASGAANSAGGRVSVFSAVQGQPGVGFSVPAAAAAEDGQLGLAHEQPHVQQQQQGSEQQQGFEQSQLQSEDLEGSMLTITPSLDLLSLLNEPADADAPLAPDAALADTLNVQLPQQQLLLQQQQQQQALIQQLHQQQCNFTEHVDYHQQQSLQQRQGSAPLLQQQSLQVPEQLQDSAPLLQLSSSCPSHYQPQQQQVSLLQMLQVKQQQQQPASAVVAAEESAFVAVQTLGSSCSVGCSRLLTAERSSRYIASRTVTGALPVLPAGFDASKQQELADADAAAAAAAAAACDIGSPRDFKQHQQFLPKEQQQEQDLVVLRHTRQITCKTYLKRLNVTQYMSDHLLPRMEGSSRVSSQKQQAAAAAGPAGSNASTRPAAGGSSSAAGSAAAAAAMTVSDDEYDPSSGKGAAGKAAGGHKVSSSLRSYEMLFKVQIKLVDSMRQIWPVTYEGVMCAGQRHLRLTCGWSEFIKAKRLAIGDAVTFERRGGNRTALAVAIARAGVVVEEAWAGVLPEDAQVKVLVGALRDGSGSPVLEAVQPPAAAAAAAALPAAACGGKRSSSTGRRSGSGGSDAGGSSGRNFGRQQAAAATAAATGRAQLKSSGRQTSLKRRARGDAGDDYDWDDRDWECDDGSSGSAAQVDSVMQPCVASRASSALLPHESAAAAAAASRGSLDMLRVASSEPWDAAAAAAAASTGRGAQQLQRLASCGPVLGRPRSFTKRPNLNLNLDGMGSPRWCAPAVEPSMMLSPTAASAAGRAVVSGQEGPWRSAQQQQKWQTQEQQLQWQRQEQQQSWQQQELAAQQLQESALGSWTYPGAAAAASTQGGMELLVDVVPLQRRRYNRQVSHPVAARELLAVQQDIAAAGNPAVQQLQQQPQLQLPSGFGDAIMEEVELGAAAAGLSGHSRRAAVLGLQQHQQQQQQHDMMLRPAASVPVLTPAAAAAPALLGQRSLPGWQVSTGFVGSGPACRYDSMYRQQQLQQLPPSGQGMHMMRRQSDASSVGAACAADAVCTDRQQYQQQGYSRVPDSPAHYAVPQHFQQQQQQQVSSMHQQQLTREVTTDPRGVVHPQLLAPPTPGIMQQQHHQTYDWPMQMPILQQQQQMPPPLTQPLASPPFSQQQQHMPRFELQQSAAAAAQAAAPAGNAWVEPAEQLHSFIQHQQRQLDAPDPDQMSCAAMESDALVDTLLQLLAEPSVNMQQAPPPAVSVQMATLMQNQQQELHQALQLEMQQQQQQPGQQGQVHAAAQAQQQQQDWQLQAMQQQQLQPHLQPQPAHPLQLLQQWSQQQQPQLPWQASAPRLVPPTLLPPEAVAAASQQLRGAGGSWYDASAAASGQQGHMGFPRQ